MVDCLWNMALNSNGFRAKSRSRRDVVWVMKSDTPQMIGIFNDEIIELRFRVKQFASIFYFMINVFKWFFDEIGTIESKTRQKGWILRNDKAHTTNVNSALIAVTVAVAVAAANVCINARWMVLILISWYFAKEFAS